jgi:HEAT repeat protein
MSPVSYQNIEEVGARRLYPIFDALMDEDSQTQETAATSLLMMGVANHGSGPRLSFREPRVIETLVHCLKSQSSNARRDCAEMLGVVGDKSATLPLTALLKDPDTDVKKSAAGALGRAMKYLKDNRPVPGLIAALKDADQSVRSDAARALESAAEAKDARLPVPLFEAYSLDRNLSVPDEIKQLNNSSEAQALAQKWKEVSEQSGEAREEAGDALGALKGYAAELKEHPNDRALREKIIALAVSMNPKPRAPEEVDELEGQAVAAFKGAQSPADFGDAVNAYKKALLLAPWAAKDYFNLGVAQEKAGSPEDAIESFRYYLLAAPDAEDAKEVRARIGGLKYQAQKASASGGSERPAQGNAQAAAELLSAFKKNAPGRYYHWSVCRGLSGGGSLFAAVSRADGCTYAEYLGSNWFVNPGAGEFRYPADGTIEFWHLSGDSAHILMKGTPKGSRLEDIEWLRCDGQTMECNAPEWVYITPNFDHLTLSTNRPVNDAASDKEAKYRYGAYH